MKSKKSTVTNLKTYRFFREQRREQMLYWHQLLGMDKANLLQELLNYHDAYQKDPHDVRVTIRGQLLMEVLESRAQLTELQDLSREFQQKLQIRLEKQLERIAL